MMCLKWLDKLGTSSPDQNKKKSSYQCIYAKSFELHPPHSFCLSPLEDTKRPQFIKLEMKTERPFLNAFFIPLRPFLLAVDL